MGKDNVQIQFGDKADAYASSRVHRAGKSLSRLVDIVRPQPTWVVLDVATGAGHTAHKLAPFVRTVMAADITLSMLTKTAGLAREYDLKNINVEMANAQALPFKDRSFDLVTCRIAPHHFPNPDQFVREAARVLRPHGLFAVVDNVAPFTRSRKKKEQAAYAAAASYLNAFEALRDPSHQKMLSLEDWKMLLYESGFILRHEETIRKALDFDNWADRMQVIPANKIRLRVMLSRPPRIVEEFLTPEFTGDRIIFYLTEGILVGEKLS